jgi:hypothetical protein
VLDMKVLSRGPLRSGEAVIDLGLPQALADIQENSIGHGGEVGVDSV